MDIENHYVCRVSVAPVRKDASDRSEIVNQLLFGDRVIVLEKTQKWYKIRTQYDNYEGWVDFKQLYVVSEKEYYMEHEYKFVSPASELNVIKDNFGSNLYLSPGTTLPFYNEGKCRIGDLVYTVMFEPIVPCVDSFYNSVDSISRFFINVPYLWGGRGIFGIDCSGFTQIVYKLVGISLNRDASQQVEQGELVDFLSAVKKGDLAFFDNENGAITHVGIMLNEREIIHSSGRVQIDLIDNQGIFSVELNRYTHNLRVIKRMCI